MSVKNLLVAYNGSDASNAALRAAILMHKKYDAHVTGLLAHQSAKSRLREETWFPDDLNTVLEGKEKAEHNRIKDAFFERTQNIISDDRLHWIEHFGNADQTVADYSLMYDFTIVGRRDVLIGNRRYEFHPERIITESGRPVLLVPRNYDEAQIHEHAILAWDGNRIATGALWAAMNILETKQKVTVLTVETGKTGSPLPGIDAETVLKRHGIAASRVFIEKQKEGVSKTILEYCDQVDAGLLVMGAFQTSFFREELFGGVTKDIMNEAKIPVLLSH